MWRARRAKREIAAIIRSGHRPKSNEFEPLWGERDVRDALWHLVLPAVCLAAYPVGLVTRMTRSAMVDVLGERYIAAARAEGIQERTIRFRLALKNAILPTLTVLGLTFAYSVTGAFLVEIVFAWPGVGTYVTQGILSVDFPVIIGVTLVVTVVYLVVNLAVDLIHAALDPRVGL